MSTYKITQTESGKAWEYGLACKFADISNTTLERNSAGIKSQESYCLMPQCERNRIDKAASEVVMFLSAQDERLSKTSSVRIQDDKTGIEGDVRDILLCIDEEEIGISAKHRHNAVKHSRLSDKIDFGKNWYGRPCSAEYWDAITPIFDILKIFKEMGLLWKQLPDKHDTYYVPILDAFMNEVNQHANPGKLLSYLLGRYDFYKVIKENGNVSLQSFNLYGKLKWGRRLPLPTKIIRFEMKPKSKTTAIMHMDTGWVITFRIHNANKCVEPSLKFDVQLLGNPNKLSMHEIPYERNLT